MDTLEQFLRTGKLGALEVGMTTEQVHNLLGAPEDVSVQKRPLIWKYGSLQVSFFKEDKIAKETLDFIGLYFHSSDAPLPSPLSWSGWQPSRETNQQEMQEYLQRNNLKFQRESFGETDHFIVPSGTRIVLHEGKLHSLQYTGRQKSRKKQVSVAVTEDVWDLIRQEAQKRKISPTDLCSELIHQGVDKK
jgi:hypothetical protein